MYACVSVCVCEQEKRVTDDRWPTNGPTTTTIPHVYTRKMCKPKWDRRFACDKEERSSCNFGRAIRIAMSRWNGFFHSSLDENAHGTHVFSMIRIFANAVEHFSWYISIDANGIVVRMWTCKHLSILYQNNHVPYKTEQWYVKWIRYYVHRFIYIFVFQVLKFGLFCFWCFYRSEVSACRGWSLNSFQFVWMSVWCAYMLFAYIYNTWHARQCQFDLLTRKYSALMPFIVDSATTT